MNNICNICGANYAYKNGKWVCPACDNIKHEEITNEEVVLLTNASTKLRMADFDEAEELYKDCIKKYPKNAEAYWGLVLSRYGIKYEEDLDGKKVPTVYATSINSILEDKDYKKAITLADKETERYYKQQAQRFENIRKEWVEKASKEQPVDIFICYKDSDEEKDIARTDDSYEAQNLYTYLMSKGYSVFFSRESLRDKVAEKYEPYIFNALNTAHVMIVYSSSKEYLESTWVKNEWSRFLKKIKSKQKQENSLILAYEKMKPSEFPKGFSSVQCMNASQKTFYEDLEKHIKKVINKATAPVARIERIEIKNNVKHKKTNVIASDIVKRDIGTYSVERLTGDDEMQLKTAYKFLNKGLFADADEIFTKIIEKNERNGQAIIGKILVNSQSKNIEDLAVNINEESNFDDIELAISYSNKEFALQILSAIKNACINYFNVGNIAFALKLADFIYNYKIEDIAFKNRINGCISILIEKEDVSNINKLVRLTLKSLIEDTDAYLQQLNEVIDLLSKKKNFDLSNEYIKEYLEIYPADNKILWKQLLNNIECSNNNELVDNIYRFDDIELFEKILEYTQEGEERTFYVDTMLTAAKICAKNIIEGKINECSRVFDNIIKYTSHDQKYINAIFDFASICQERRQFILAEKYFAIVISEDGKNHNAYWKLLQSKLKSVNNTELIQQPIIITSLSEFHSAIVATGDDEKSADRYIDLKAKQLQYIEKQKILKAKQKRKRKIASIFAACFSVVFAVAMGVMGWTLHYNEGNQLKFSLTSDGEGYVVVSGQYYNPTELTIPRFYNGKPVLKIGKNAFKNKDLVEINIPNTIREIDDSAFYNCVKLEEFNIYSTSEQNDMINDDLISFIYPLTDCTIKKGYSSKNAQYNEVEGWWELHTGIDFTSNSDNQVKAVADGVITSVYENLTEGGVVEIQHSEKLKTVYKSLKNIQYYVGAEVKQGDVIGQASNSMRDSICDNGYVHFEVYSDNTRVDPNNYFVGVTIRSQEDDNVYYIDSLNVIGDYAFYNCKELEEVILPQTTNQIGKYAFANCYSLNGFQIPSSLTRIEDSTFENSFKSIDVDIVIPKGIEYIGANAFANCSKIKNFYIEERDTIPTDWDEDWHDDSGVQVLWAMPLLFDYRGATSGNNVRRTSVVYGKSFSCPTPERDGYIFAGWFGLVNSQEVQYTGPDGLSIQVWNENSTNTAYAKWTANNNTLIFNGNGSTSGEMKTQVIKTDESAVLYKNAFVKEGYTFKGWSTTSNGIVVYENEDSYKMGVNSSYNLYAIWEANTNILRFDGNLSTDGEMRAINLKTDQSIVLPGCEFEREYYDFQGWSTESDGDVDYLDGESYTMGPNSEYTLYAIWRGHPYTITYVGDDYEINSKTQTVYYDESYVLNIPQKAGYSFVGWYIDGETKLENGICQFTSDIELEAKWEANLNVIEFNSNGADEGTIANKTAYTGTKIVLPENNYTRENYVFVGWSSTADGIVEYYVGDEYVVDTAHKQTIYAVWALPISTKEDLLSLSGAQEIYALVNDIDLDLNSYDSSPISKFDGALYGRNYSVTIIKKSTYDWANTSYSISFALIQKNDGVIRDLNLTSNIDISNEGDVYIAGLVLTNNGTIRNVNIDGNLRSFNTYSLEARVGGIALYNYGEISFSSNNSTIYGRSLAGGLAALNYGQIKCCRNTGDVTSSSLSYRGEAYTSTYAGGIVAKNEEGIILDCNSNANIDAWGRSAYVGAIVGCINKGEIKGCSAFGSATARDDNNGSLLGGIVGQIVGDEEVVILGCNSAASLIVKGTSNSTGGIVGSNDGNSLSVINDCEFTGNIILDTYSKVCAGGIVGRGGNVTNSYSDFSIKAINSATEECAVIVGNWTFGNIKNSVGVLIVDGAKTMGKVYSTKGDSVNLDNLQSTYGKIYAYRGSNITNAATNNDGLDLEHSFEEGIVLDFIFDTMNWDEELWENYITNNGYVRVKLKNNASKRLRYVLDGGVNNVHNLFAYLPTIGESNFSLEEPTKEGCTFLGWYLDETLTEKIETLNGQTEDLILYAAWGEGLIYLIDNEDELRQLSTITYWSQYDKYLLRSDIDLQNQEWTPIGITTPFEGIFDGNGHTIRNLKIDSNNTINNGLFAVNNGTICNLGIENINFNILYGADTTTNQHIGAIAGVNNGVIYNTYVDGGTIKTNARYIGGFVGRMGEKSEYNSTVYSCYTSLNIVIVGTDDSVEYHRCGGFTTDGIGTVRNCFANCDISIELQTEDYQTFSCGKFLGINLPTLSYNDCYYAKETQLPVADDVDNLITPVYGTETNRQNFYSKTWMNENVFNAGDWLYSEDTLPRIKPTTKYAIVYDGNGATSGSMDVEFFTSETHELTVNKFVKDGYIFKGWATTPDGKVELADNANLTVSEGKIKYTLYAVWEENIKEIRTIADLQSIANDIESDVHYNRYVLKNDIDLIGLKWAPIGTFDKPFSSCFDGNGFTISNLYVYQGYVSSGLFAYVSNGQIKNLRLKDVTIAASIDNSTKNYVQAGAFIGCALDNTFLNNCCASVNIQAGSKYGVYVGGLIGSGGTSIADCYVEGHVGAATTGDAVSYVGGLVGSSSAGIGWSYSTCTVWAQHSREYVVNGCKQYCGGLVGKGGKLYQCYATGDVLAISGYFNYAGGLTTGETEIVNSYRSSDQKVTATTEICREGISADKETILNYINTQWSSYLWDLSLTENPKLRLFENS